MNQVAGVRAPLAECPSCGRPVTVSRSEHDSFQYGLGEDSVTLTAEVSVLTCGSCGTEFTTADAEDARHEAVCRHLRVLSPREIRDLRRKFCLSRSEFAKVTRIGEATLARWERGSLIQNAGYDQLLRLLSWPDNMERLRVTLRDSHAPLATVTTLAQFRHLTRSPELEHARSAFALRKQGR